jgi:serine protease Do
VSSMAPGTEVRLDVVRDGHASPVSVRLAERPIRNAEPRDDSPAHPSSNRRSAGSDNPIGVSVRDLDRDDVTRMELPQSVRGAVILRVEPLSAAYDANLERGQVILEVNRHPVGSATDFRRLAADAHAGDVLTLYLYLPDAAEHALRTVRIDAP